MGLHNFHASSYSDTKKNNWKKFHIFFYEFLRNIPQVLDNLKNTCLPAASELSASYSACVIPPNMLQYLWPKLISNYQNS